MDEREPREVIVVDDWLPDQIEDDGWCEGGTCNVVILEHLQEGAQIIPRHDHERCATAQKHIQIEDAANMKERIDRRRDIIASDGVDGLPCEHGGNQVLMS